jgi:hypothetical protein
MTLLFCGVFFPFFDPLFLVPALGIMILSAFFVYKGISGFARSEEKSKLLLSVGILWVTLMLPYVVFDIPVLTTLPFGLGIGLVPFIYFEFFIDHARDNLLPHHLAMGIGCLLNAIAILYLTDRISKRIRGDHEPLP